MLDNLIRLIRFPSWNKVSILFYSILFDFDRVLYYRQGWNFNPVKKVEFNSKVETMPTEEVEIFNRKFSTTCWKLLMLDSVCGTWDGCSLANNMKWERITSIALSWWQCQKSISNLKVNDVEFLTCWLTFWCPKNMNLLIYWQPIKCIWIISMKYICL
jgi:hypothetical protein